MARNAVEQDDEVERETRRRAAQALIRQFPDPVLRAETKEVDAFDETLVELVDRMIDIAQDAVGAGLAAPQVGIVRRVAVVHLSDDEPWVAMVNPEIVARSEETAVGGEGCLSLDYLLRQGHHVPVERAVGITVRWRDVTGEAHERELVDMPARVVQHEVDHLDGILTVDRAVADDRREALRVLREGLV
jgi:peptide deformylase